MDVRHAKRLLVEERDRLQELADDLEDSGGLDESQQASSGSLTDHDQHVGDVASQTFQRERDISIEEGLESKRNAVSDALERIENGDYGNCEVCGAEISDERLAALPATRYCAEHASETEEGTLPSGGGWSVTQELGPHGNQGDSES